MPNKENALDAVVASETMRLLTLLMACLLALSAMIVLPSAAAHFCQEGNPRHETPCGECPDGESHEHFHQDGTLHCHSNGSPPDPSDPPTCEEQPFIAELVCMAQKAADSARERVDDVLDDSRGWVQCINDTRIGDVLDTVGCVPPCNQEKYDCSIRLDLPDELMLLA